MTANNNSVDKDTIYQVSTYGILLGGILDGFISVKDLKKMGDFGIGGITGLDGEILILDGNFYRADVDGNIAPVGDNEMSPKMILSFFKEDQSVALDHQMNYQELKEFTETILPTKNIMYGIKVEADFQYIRTECFPKKTKPYPHANEIAATKKVLELENIRGTLGGYIMPAHLGEIATVRYHMHFVSADRKLGGHLVDFQLLNGNMQIDYKHNLKLILPKNNSDFYKLDLTNSIETLKEFERRIRNDNEPKNILPSL